MHLNPSHCFKTVDYRLVPTISPSQGLRIWLMYKLLRNVVFYKQHTCLSAREFL
jgi:hypothetical protein